MNREEIATKATSRGVQFIMECVQGGIDDYANSKNYSDAAKHDHSVSVAAACINSHIVARAKRMSMEMQGFLQIKERRGRTTFILADYTEVWYKKLNQDGKPSFRSSKQALKYIEPLKQQLQLGIDMPPERERWVAGYKASSPAATEFQIVVAGRKKNGEWWEVPLTGAEIPTLFPAPVPAPIPAATTEVLKKRVRIRKQREA